MSYQTPGATFISTADSGFVTYYLDYQLKGRDGRQLWIQIRLNGRYSQPIPAVVDDFGDVVALV